MNSAPGSDKRLPSLDGLRAVSIVAVIASHVLFRFFSPAYMSVLGRLGVQVFFVVSGFLITYLLISEDREAGAVSLPHFYARRALRIIPPYACYLVMVAAMAWFGFCDVSARELRRSALFLTNYGQGQVSWLVGHTWSLSTEEQFYLAWPVLFVMAGRRLRRSALVVLAFVAANFPLLRATTLHFFPGLASPLWAAMPNGSDGIAAGCILALVWTRLHQSESFAAAVRSPLAHLGGIGLVAYVALAADRRLEFAFSLVMNWLIVLLVVRTVSIPTDRWGRLMNWQPVALVGAVSYSLYLWQQPFTIHESASWLERPPFNLVAMTACAAASFFVVERPFLRLRTKLRFRPRLSAPPELVATGETRSV